MDYSLIENLCRQSNLSTLPALRQMKIAIEENRVNDAERIAKNIVIYLKSNNIIPKRNSWFNYED